jgi:hypothetical protein
MSKKIADKGSSEAFLRDNLNALTDECIDWPFCLNDRGYGLAVIDGKQRTASRWMCILAHGKPTKRQPHAAHNCGRPSCVNPRHLRWASPKENARDRRLHGTENIGENSGKTHLTEEDVRAIRAAPPKLKPLMEKYGISKGAVAKIRSRQRWGHIS